MKTILILVSFGLNIAIALGAYSGHVKLTKPKSLFAFVSKAETPAPATPSPSATASREWMFRKDGSALQSGKLQPSKR